MIFVGQIVISSFWLLTTATSVDLSPPTGSPHRSASTCRMELKIRSAKSQRPAEEHLRQSQTEGWYVIAIIAIIFHHFPYIIAIIFQAE